jgi:hypothetical protein
MSWLRKWNPAIDWATLTLRFPESLRSIKITAPSPCDSSSDMLQPLPHPRESCTATETESTAETLDAPTTNRKASKRSKTKRSNPKSQTDATQGNPTTKKERKPPPISFIVVGLPCVASV